MEADEHTYKSLAHSINQSKKGSYDFIFNAPVLILTANRRGHGNAQADSAAAIENMLLASHAQDLGACWINQLKWLTAHPTVRKYLCSLGLGAEEDIFGGLCVGWPAKQSGAPLPRKGNPVTWI